MNTLEMTADKFTPSPGILVVEVEKISEKTNSGIIKGAKLTEEEKRELAGKAFCTVVAVGDGCDDIQVGDLILPARGLAQLPLKASEGKDIAWIKKHDVIGVIKNEAK